MFAIINNQPIKPQMVVFCCKIRSAIWGYPGFRATTQRHQMGISGIRSKQLHAPYQSQKTERFCYADFATLSDERRSRSKIFPQFIWMKESCIRKFEGFEHLKLLGISQTNMVSPRLDGLRNGKRQYLRF